MATYDSTVRYHLRREVVRVFHEDLYRRYDASYLESIDVVQQENLLEGISGDDINRVKQFFAHVLYPTIEEREERDQSLEALATMLRSPARLLAFLPSVPKLMLKHGGSIKTALRSGQQVVEAYQLGSELEDELVDKLIEVYEEEGREVSTETRVDYELYVRAYSRVDQEKNRRLATSTEELIGLSRDRDLLDAGVETLETFRQAAHHEEEKAATDYVLSVLQEVTEISDSLSDEAMSHMVRIAEVTERHYQEKMLEAAHSA